MPGKILLLNTNRMRPRIAPIGLDYVGSSLLAAGAKVRLFDLALCERAWQSRLKKTLDEFRPHLIGVTVRNIDDCYFLSGKFLAGPIKYLVNWLRRNSPAKTVLGGVGYSIAPFALREYLGADYGVWGDGEQAAVSLLSAVAAGREPLSADIPGLVAPDQMSRRAEIEPDAVWRDRKLSDNSLYFRLGGQAGVETKRGCNGSCIYCAEIISKGARVRLRSPAAVADELEELLSQGAWAFHTCDSEFNRPVSHAVAVLEEIVKRGLGKKIHLYAYLSPRPFDRAFARLFAAAGGKGICFGADSGSDEILSALKRDHWARDLATAVVAASKAGVRVMYDLLLGGPGETRKTLAETIRLMKKLKPDRVGVSWGVRVYEGTELQRMVMAEMNSSNPGFIFPEFYLAPALEKDGLDYLRGLIGNDTRFFLPAKTVKRQNYNYSGNLFLERLVKKGARGAYWKILYDHSEGME